MPDKNARIIDIGCANGGLLKEIQSLGYRNLLGVDPSEMCVERTRTQLGISAMIGSLSNIPEQLGKFDLVILSHVLEHVLDLNQAVYEISNLVSENGSVYVEVPDATRYADRVIAPFQDINTEHVNHFSLNALRNLFSKVEFIAKSEVSRSIRITIDADYPVTHMVLQKGKPEMRIQFDEILNNCIIRYITESKKILTKLDQRLQVILAGNPMVIIWGTGQLAMKLLADTCLGGARIFCYVDSNPINQGKKIQGIPIVSPESIRYKLEPIIIASTIYQDNIVAQIREMGLPNELILLKG